MPTKEKGCLRRFLAMCIIFLMGSLSLSIPAVAADAKLATVERSSQEVQTSPQPMIRASRVLDRTVYNERGEEIGEVNDLIMSRNGKIKKVILSVGKFLETGEKLVAVPFGSLEESNKGVIYRVTKEQIKHHPRFNYWTEGLFGRPFDPFPPYGVRWGYQAPFPPSGGDSGPVGRRGKYRGEVHPWEWGYYPERLRVSALLDEGILNNAGEEVADLEDLMISPKGKVEQFILDVGGFFGMPEKLVAAPYRPLKITDLGIVYNITKEQLQKAPGFIYERR